MTDAITKLQEALQLLTNATVIQHCNIGIGITTHNRYDTFKASYDQILRLAPEGAKIVVVDDASSTPVTEATFRFSENAGIAQAKNKCFELLEDCEHIFLFDDDTYPLKPDWHKPYIESDQPHLMYIFQDFSGSRKLNDTILLYQDEKLKAWSHARGCMLYFRKECLKKVGGMYSGFGKWGWEHPDLSNRIYNAGLTRFKYADVADSSGLFYSSDEHETVTSTVTGDDRSRWINRNREIYESRRSSAEFVSYKAKRNIILTSYFTGQTDPQRGTGWEPNIDDLRPLIDSCGDEQLTILHDCFDSTPPMPGVTFIRVSTNINPYFQRWLSYRTYLTEHLDEIDKVFCVDATDVQVLRSPWDEMSSNILYTGDECEFLNCEWMVKNHQHPTMVKWIEANSSQILLNAGLLGGDVETVTTFMQYLLDFYFVALTDANFHQGRADAGHTDMGVFNYVARDKFGDRLVHGIRVNTRFKGYEKDNKVAWFKHK